ncbi:MAG: magnesium transporter [Chloroflexales bacterium]|nr:magnesium transporter [Chloroflexales bacterium]
MMLFLASILDRPVHGKSGEPIGTLEDLIVRIDSAIYPLVSGLVVRDGRRRFFVPGTHLYTLGDSVTLGSSTVDLQPFARRDGEVLLRSDVLDHQLIDITGRRIVRVNDVQLAFVEGAYRVAGVDVSPQALLRRLGPRPMAQRIVARQVIDWADAQYLASAAPVQLKVSYNRLSELNPVDLARIVDALSYREGAEIVAALDDETAAETLEEVSDERLADLLEGMDQERAADILEEMSPSAAADVLEDMDAEIAEQLLAKMEPDEAADVQQLLAYDESSAGRILTANVVRVPEGATVGDTNLLLHAIPDEDLPDPLLAIYVVSADNSDRLRGIVRLRTLLSSTPEQQMTDLMETDMPTAHPDDPAESVARLLAEYNLLALPVLDDDETFLGVVTVDDALAVLLPEVWQRRKPF